MIDHDLKCIFIHVPRCAGTSVEQWLCGRDWWEIEPSSKHLIASQARIRYADHWDTYFKFAIVRDPYTRVPSLLRYGGHFGLTITPDGILDVSGYERRFGAEVILEHDHRFARREAILLARHRPNRVYGNILDEELDFVARFETLDRDMAVVRDRLGIARAFDLHVERSGAGGRAALADRDRAWIASAYADDIAAYGYGS